MQIYIFKASRTQFALKLDIVTVFFLFSCQNIYRMLNRRQSAKNVRKRMHEHLHSLYAGPMCISSTKKWSCLLLWQTYISSLNSDCLLISLDSLQLLINIRFFFQNGKNNGVLNRLATEDLFKICLVFPNAQVKQHVATISLKFFWNLNRIH